MSLEKSIPKLDIMDEEQKQLIHRYALKVLETCGVRVDYPPVLKGLEKELPPTLRDGNRVRLPRELVEWAIQQAPAEIDVYDRLGEKRFTLGNDRTRFGIGVTTLFYQRPEDDSLEPFARRHMQDVTRLGDALPYYDVVSTIGIVQDVAADVSDLYGTVDMLANTTKPLVILVSDENRFGDVLDLIEHCCGELSVKPFVIPYFNPVTPLVLNSGTLEKMEIAIQRGLPIIFSNYSMAGMSTPITPAGTMVTLLAELLAGLTVSQLIRAGAPVILGMLPAWFDMKTMVNFYDPQSILMNLACAEMMDYYHIPHAGTSGSGTGWGPDLLAAETYWMNHLSACLGRVGLAPFVGDNLTSKAFSAVNVVMAHEIIAQSLMFSEGLDIGEEAAVLDEICQMGAGGNFLNAPSTRQRYRKAYYTSPIFPRWSMEKWLAEGRPRADQVLRKRTLDLLATVKPPPDGSALTEKGERWIKNKFGDRVG
ncbi:MAG: trimethylamine methyltransferase family protein [Chloroflexota bacterium]